MSHALEALKGKPSLRGKEVSRGMVARAKARAPARKSVPARKFSSSKKRQHVKEEENVIEEEEEQEEEEEEQQVVVADFPREQIRVEVNRTLKLGGAHAGLFNYAAKIVKACPENMTCIKQIAEGGSDVNFVPVGYVSKMTVTVLGKPISLAKGTIWVPANPAQRFEVCQNQVQAEEICGVGELTSTFYCSNLSLPCATGIPFIPTVFTLTASKDQTSVWAATDGPSSKKLTREQALQRRLNKLPKVLGSGGTETLAKVTAVSGRWLEIQTAGDLRADQACVSNGWAQAFLERSPWRGNLRPDVRRRPFRPAILRA
jgi:hypothetical protein